MVLRTCTRKASGERDGQGFYAGPRSFSPTNDVSELSLTWGKGVSPVQLQSLILIPIFSRATKLTCPNISGIADVRENRTLCDCFRRLIHLSFADLIGR